MALSGKDKAKRKPPVIDPKSPGAQKPVTFKDLDDPERWQALFRAGTMSATTGKFFNYIKLADQKAQGLILLNSVLIPLALNWIERPLFHLPVIVTIVTGVFSIMMAIICLYPKSRKRKKNTPPNLLHFGDIGRMKEQDYLDAFMPVFNDLPRLSEACARDLHDIASRIIRPKFYWLRLSYLIFFFGNVGAIGLTFYNMWLQAAPL